MKVEFKKINFLLISVFTKVFTEVADYFNVHFLPISVFTKVADNFYVFRDVLFVLFYIDFDFIIQYSITTLLKNK